MSGAPGALGRSRVTCAGVPILPGGCFKTDSDVFSSLPPPMSFAFAVILLRTAINNVIPRLANESLSLIVVRDPNQTHGSTCCACRLDSYVHSSNAEGALRRASSPGARGLFRYAGPARGPKTAAE